MVRHCYSRLAGGAMLTSSSRPPAWRRVGCLASVWVMLACSAPGEPVPPVVLRILGDPHRSMLIGEGVPLSVVAVDAQGGETIVPATWSSSNPRAGGVDSQEVLRARGYGEATITARYRDGLATVTMSAQPKGLRVRLVAAGSIIEEGRDYEVVADFLDVHGGVTVVPWEVDWDASAGARLLPAGAQSSQTLRALRTGDIEVTASSGPLRAPPLGLTVRPRGELILTVSHFVLWADLLPDGRMRYYPDLVVVGNFDGAITRLEFDRPLLAACANAAMLQEKSTPLFDFIPYDFSWTGAPLTVGSTIGVLITARRDDGAVMTLRAVGELKLRRVSEVIDYGTGSFPWSLCQ